MAIQGKLQIPHGLSTSVPGLDATAVGFMVFATDTQQVLIANGTGFSTVGEGAGGPPTGAAGGDLSGVYPNPVVAKINDAAIPQSSTYIGTNSSGQIVTAPTPTTALASLTDVSLSSPSNGQLLAYNGTASKWENIAAPSTSVTLTGVVTGTGTGTVPTVFGSSATATSSSLGVVKPDDVTIVINGSGTLTAIGVAPVGNVSANLVYAGPASGFAAVPTFRSLISADMPPATSGLIGAVQPDGTTLTVNGSGIISAIAGRSAINQLTGDVTAGPGTGSVAATLANTAVSPGSYTFANITVDSKGRLTSASSGTPGTVFSVGLSMPAEYNVTGTPVTNTGTLTVTKANQNPNVVYAGPGGGSSPGSPSFRALVPIDLPTATATTQGAVVPDNSTISISGGVISAIAGTAGISQLTGEVLAGPGSGSQSASLSTTGVTAGSYVFASITVDAKGRITSASNGSAGGGTVTSVNMSVPGDIFSLSGNPITSSGTLVVGKQNQSANTVWAGPTSGSASQPTFRALVAADLPLATASAFGAVKPDGTTITISGGVISVSGAGITQLTGDVTAGPGSGSQAATVVRVNGASVPTNATYLKTNNLGQLQSTTAVSSLTIAVPAFIMTVSGSPVTTSGTITLGFANQSANLVFAGPSSGAAAAPTFRSLIASDMPLATNSLVGAIVPDGTTVTVSGGVLSAITGAAGINQLTGDVLAGPGAGSVAATLSTTGVTAGSYGAANITVDAKGRISSASSSAIVTFVLGSGIPNATAAWALAPRASNIITTCKIYVVTSDATVDLIFDILKNGTTIFTAPITIPHATTAGSIVTVTSLATSPLPIAVDDKLVLNISTGSSNWTGTIQLR